MKLYIKLPKTNPFVKYFDSNINYIDLLVHDKEKKFTAVWDKVKNLFIK